MRKTLPVIGWREWLSLPDMGVDWIKAKIDTGARSSSLHAFDIEEYTRHGNEYVRFCICPDQKSKKSKLWTTAKVLEYRKIKSSNGHVSLRPVILTTIGILDELWEIELTLANRDEMGFRMLLGREAIRKRAMIDCGRSYFGGTPD